MPPAAYVASQMAHTSAAWSSERNRSNTAKFCLTPPVAYLQKERKKEGGEKGRLCKCFVADMSSSAVTSRIHSHFEEEARESHNKSPEKRGLHRRGGVEFSQNSDTECSHEHRLLPGRLDSDDQAA